MSLLYFNERHRFEDYAKYKSAGGIWEDGLPEMLDALLNGETDGGEEIGERGNDVKDLPTGGQPSYYRLFIQGGGGAGKSTALSMINSIIDGGEAFLDIIFIPYFAELTPYFDDGDYMLDYFVFRAGMCMVTVKDGKNSFLELFDGWEAEYASLSFESKLLYLINMCRIFTVEKEAYIIFGIDGADLLDRRKLKQFCGFMNSFGNDRIKLILCGEHDSCPDNRTLVHVLNPPERVRRITSDQTALENILLQDADAAHVFNLLSVSIRGLGKHELYRAMDEFDKNGWAEMATGKALEKLRPYIEDSGTRLTLSDFVYEIMPEPDNGADEYGYVLNRISNNPAGYMEDFLDFKELTGKERIGEFMLLVSLKPDDMEIYQQQLRGLALTLMEDDGICNAFCVAAESWGEDYERYAKAYDLVLHQMIPFMCSRLDGETEPNYVSILQDMLDGTGTVKGLENLSAEICLWLARGRAHEERWDTAEEWLQTAYSHAMSADRPDQSLIMSICRLWGDSLLNMGIRHLTKARDYYDGAISRFHGRSGPEDKIEFALALMGRGDAELGCLLEKECGFGGAVNNYETAAAVFGEAFEASRNITYFFKQVEALAKRGVALISTNRERAAAQLADARTLMGSAPEIFPCPEMKMADAIIFFGLGTLARLQGGTEQANACFLEAAGRGAQMENDKTTPYQRGLIELFYAWGTDNGKLKKLYEEYGDNNYLKRMGMA